MTYDQYINEIQSLSFTQKGQAAFGEYRGYPLYCMFSGKTQAKMVVMLVSVEGKRQTKFIRELNRSIKGLGNALYKNSDGSVIQINLEVKDGFEGPFRQVMDRLAEAAAGYGITPSSTCPICHQGNCDGWAFMGDGYCAVHENCLRQMHSDVRSDAQRNMTEGSYLTGILGGLAGGLVAAIPCLLTILLAKTVYALLVWLIPIGAAFGYQKCNGKRSRAAGPILILVSVVSMFLMEYVFYVVQWSAIYDWGAGEALATTLPFMLDPSFWIAVVQDSVAELIFLALGIVVSWKTLSGTAAEDVSNVEACLATYQPKASAGMSARWGQRGGTEEPTE